MGSNTLDIMNILRLAFGFWVIIWCIAIIVVMIIFGWAINDYWRLIFASFFYGRRPARSAGRGQKQKSIAFNTGGHGFWVTLSLPGWLVFIITYFHFFNFYFPKIKTRIKPNQGDVRRSIRAPDGGDHAHSHHHSTRHALRGCRRQTGDWW